MQQCIWIASIAEFLGEVLSWDEDDRVEGDVGCFEASLRYANLRCKLIWKIYNAMTTGATERLNQLKYYSHYLRWYCCLRLLILEMIYV